MSLRWKIALALAGLTFVASAVVGAAVYRVTKDRLLSEIDRSLAEVNPRPGRGPFALDELGDRGPLRGVQRSAQHENTGQGRHPGNGPEHPATHQRPRR